jgi:hypothetical protein
VAAVKFAPDARTFSLHYCQQGKSRRFLVLCKYCARRVKSGGHVQKGEPVKWLCHIPSRQPNA